MIIIYMRQGDQVTKQETPLVLFHFERPKKEIIHIKFTLWPNQSQSIRLINDDFRNASLGRRKDELYGGTNS